VLGDIGDREPLPLTPEKSKNPAWWKEPPAGKGGSRSSSKRDLRSNCAGKKVDVKTALQKRERKKKWSCALELKTPGAIGDHRGPKKPGVKRGEKNWL